MAFVRFSDESNHIDEHFFVEALKYGQNLVGSGALQNITLQVLDPPLFSTDQSLRTYIRDRLTTNYHLIGKSTPFISPWREILSRVFSRYCRNASERGWRSGRFDTQSLRSF